MDQGVSGTEVRRRVPGTGWIHSPFSPLDLNWTGPWQVVTTLHFGNNASRDRCNIVVCCTESIEKGWTSNTLYWNFFPTVLVNGCLVDEVQTGPFGWADPFDS